MKRIVWLGFLAAALIVAFAPIPQRLVAPRERNFRIEASSFEFSPAEIRVNPGDRVNIDLISTDVVHGLYVDGYDTAVTADPGQAAKLSFIADRPGSYRMRCNVTCGAMHPFMIGKLTVGSNTSLYRGAGLVVLALGAALAAGHFHRQTEA